MGKLKKIRKFFQFARTLASRPIFSGHGPPNLAEIHYIADGCGWIITKRTPLEIWLQCQGSGNISCEATAVIQLPSLEFQPSPSMHNHFRHGLMKELEALYQLLMKESVYSLRSFGDIYEDATEQFAYELMYKYPLPIAHDHMRRWRGLRIFPHVDSYEGFISIINEPPWDSLLISYGMMDANCVWADDGTQLLLIGDVEFRKVLPEMTKISVTFISKVIPPIGNSRFVICVAAEYRGYAFVFAWGICSDMTAALCRRLFSCINNDYFTHIAPPKVVVTNFTYECRQAAQAVWPQARIEVTFLQYSCAIYHKAHVMGIDINNHENAVMLRKVTALALLPANQVQDGLVYLWGSMDDKLRQTFKKLVDWYRIDLIQTLTPESFSVFGNMSAISTIDWKIAGRMHIKVKDKEPDIWHFLVKCTKIIHESWRNVRKVKCEALNNHIVTTTSPKMTILVGIDQFPKLWRMRQKRVSIASILTFGAHYQKHQHDLILSNTCMYMNGKFSPVPPRVHGTPAGFSPRSRADQDSEELLRKTNMEEPSKPNMSLSPVNCQQPAVEEAEELDPYEWQCAVCEVAPIKVVCKPCHCICICQQCADLQIADKCPMCGQPIVGFEMARLPLNHEAKEGENPFCWLCPVCMDEDNPVSVLSTSCMQVSCCESCAKMVRNTARNTYRAITCPACNIPSPLINVYIRPS